MSWYSNQFFTKELVETSLAVTISTCAKLERFFVVKDKFVSVTGIDFQFFQQELNSE